MFDLGRLEAYLAAHVPGFQGPVEVRAFDEGQSNPTFLLTTPGARYVLRKKPPGVLLKSAHAVDREYRVQAALWGRGVPVARVLHLCEDEGVLGTMFYVMEHAEGRIFWDPALPGLSAGERGAVYGEMNRVLAAIHDVDLAAAGLADYGRGEGYFARQLRLWSTQYREGGRADLPALEELAAWLEAHLPEDDGQVALVHGDYRIDNLMFARDRIEIIAVFDWELSTLGHPLADLAYQVMQRAMGRDWHLPGLAGLDVAALGIPSEAEYVADYCRRRGIDALADWEFAKVFAFFRFSAICLGVKRRGLEGNAASPDALKVGAMAAPLAELGCALVNTFEGGA